MSALQVIIDRLNRQIDDLNKSIYTLGVARRHEEDELRKLVRERDCPQRNCSLKRPGERSLEAIMKDMASTQCSIARHEILIARASKRRDILTVCRNAIKRYVRPSAVHL